jgi:hypothetical protein
MVLPRVRSIVLLAVLFASGAARADRKEVYTVLGYQAGASHYLLPATGSGSVTSYAGALDASAYYGLTNALHVGGRVRVTSSSDVHFSGTTVILSDGSQSTGDVYDDHRALGVGALALYRVDTGSALAPVIELEGGFTIHEYRRIAHVPGGAAYAIPLASVSELVLHGAGALLFEYRLGKRWMFATGVGVHVEAGGLTPWSVIAPFRIGFIW